MKCKVVIKWSYEFLIFFLLIATTIVDNDCFRLFKIDSGLLKVLKLLLILLCFGLIILRKKNLEKIRIYSKFTFGYLWIIIFFLIVQFIYTVVKYPNESIFAFFQAAQGYLWVTLTVPLLYLFNSYIGIEKVLDIIKYIVFFSLALVLLEAFTYNVLNIQFLNIGYYKEFLIRNDRLRILDLSSLKALVIIWCFYEVLYRKKARIMNITMVITMLLTLFYVEQARMVQISILVAMVIMLITKKDTNRYFLVFKTLGLIATFLFVISSGSINRLFGSFSINGQLANSTIIRLHEIQYAFELIPNNLINGVGLITGVNRRYYAGYSGRGNFGLTDIGIIGLLLQIGLWTIFLYIIPLSRFLYITYKVKKKDTNYFYPLLLGILIYLIVSSWTIIILNISRIYMWPFCISIFEYCYGVFKQNEMMNGSIKK